VIIYAQLGTCQIKFVFERVTRVNGNNSEALSYLHELTACLVLAVANQISSKTA
jgi:hypothetical protein